MSRLTLSASFKYLSLPMLCYESTAIIKFTLCADIDFRRQNLTSESNSIPALNGVSTERILINAFLSSHKMLLIFSVDGFSGGVHTMLCRLQ